jgi:hypothetical protein
MWRGYEVSGMILLFNLQVAMQLGCCKDMSVHVSTSTSYNFNASMPGVWKLWG